MKTALMVLAGIGFICLAVAMMLLAFDLATRERYEWARKATEALFCAAVGAMCVPAVAAVIHAIWSI